MNTLMKNIFLLFILSLVNPALNAMEKAQYTRYFNSEVGRVVFQCKDCDHETYYQSNVISHWKQIHTNIRIHQCEYPGCSFSSVGAGDLTRHVDEVHLKKEKQHKCPYDGCVYRAARYSTLKDHIDRMHINKKPTSCLSCGKAFDSSTACAAHMRACDVKPTNNKRPRETDENNSSSQPKKRAKTTQVNNPKQDSSRQPKKSSLISKNENSDYSPGKCPRKEIVEMQNRLAIKMPGKQLEQEEESIEIEIDEPKDQDSSTLKQQRKKSSIEESITLPEPSDSYPYSSSSFEEVMESSSPSYPVEEPFLECSDSLLNLDLENDDHFNQFSTNSLISSSRAMEIDGEPAIQALSEEIKYYNSTIPEPVYLNPSNDIRYDFYSYNFFLNYNPGIVMPTSCIIPEPNAIISPSINYSTQEATSIYQENSINAFLVEVPNISFPMSNVAAPRIAKKDSALCEICHKRCADELSYQKHLQDLHSPGIFTCKLSQCKQTFNTKYELHSHPCKSKTYNCDFQGCNMAFQAATQLEMHKRKHTNERPFKCEVEGCGKAFKQKKDPTNHSYTHSGERPFKCTKCGQGFVQKSHLNTHARDKPNCYKK